MEPFAAVRNPAYTGANRCLPCTVVNVLLAAGGAALVGVVVAGRTTPLGGVLASLVTFLASVALVYLRGYLVPGTPELTKRYLPAWVLGWFGKAPPAAGHSESRAADHGVEQFDVERELLAVDAVEPCADVDDLCLTDWFREAWQRELASGDLDRSELLACLGLSSGDVTIEEYGDAFQARRDGMTFGTWPSAGAFEADLAAARVLDTETTRWEDLPVQERGEVLAGLRLFLDTCPNCGGAPTLDRETVESCCSEYEVAAVTCVDCGVRLFESSPL